jgi:hypothetical protein
MEVWINIAFLIRSSPMSYCPPRSISLALVSNTEALKEELLFVEKDGDEGTGVELAAAALAAKADGGGGSRHTGHREEAKPCQ